MRVELALPGLYNVENALAAAASPSRSASRWTTSPTASRASAPRSAASSGCASPRPSRDAADQEPRRRQRGAAHPARRGDATLLVALNDRIADGRDVSWIWDVDWEVDRAAPAATSSAPARAPRTSRCGSSTRASTLPRSRSSPTSRARSTALADVAAGGTAYVLPTYTAMLELQGIAPSRGLVRPYWEEAAA